MGATVDNPGLTDPPRVKCVLVPVCINGHELMALLDTGCEVDAISEETATRCSLPIQALQQRLRLRFADGRLDGRLGKVTDVTCLLGAGDGVISMVRDYYVGPIHHDVILGMPWFAQWHAHVALSQGLIEAIVPGDGRRITFRTHPAVPLTASLCGVEADEEIALTSAEVEAEVDAGAEAYVIRSKMISQGASLSDAASLSPGEQATWGALQAEYIDVLNNEELPAGRPPTDRPTHRIDLVPGAAPSYAPRYRRPPLLEEEIERQVDELLAKDKIQESTSPFAHNPVLVKRKDGRWRMCVNYKPLNKITIKQKFPMPRVDELLDRLQGATVFSAIDFTDAFLQIGINENDQHKTAFHTKTRKMEYTCMPFGLVNAPAELQRQVNRDFAGPISEGWLVVYMDDLLVFSRSVTEHIQHLRILLGLIREKQWYVKAKKCSFFMSIIGFLGFRVSAQGVEVDPAKMETIKSWPLPLYSQEDVRSFYGLASFYRSFVPGFAKIAAPLTELLRKDTPFIWTEEQEKAARTLIGCLTSSPVLALPNFNESFYLTADASDAAVGAVLSQKSPINGKHQIISCHSHRFAPAERKYPVREKELYAVVWGVKKCRHYLYGRHFIVQTDHQSLAHLDKSMMDYDNNRVIRWLVTLSQYDYTVQYIKGITNVVADALSRRPLAPATCGATAVITDGSHFLTKLRAAYALDSFAAGVVAQLEAGRRVKKYSLDDGLLWVRLRQRFKRLYIPASLRPSVLRRHHDHLLGGHGGAHTTVDKLSKLYWWPGMRNSAADYAITCPACQQLKPRNTLKPGLLQSLPTPDRVWTDICMDFVVAFPMVRGCDSVLVVVDRLSKYAHFLPCASTITAEGVANLFVDQVWKLHGTPRSIVSDRDPKFHSAIWKSFMQRLGVQLCMTTANHPEGDGQTERTNRTMIQFLRMHVDGNPSRWLDLIPCAEFVYNTTVHSSIGCTPASLVYTHSPMQDPPLELAVRSQQNLEEEEGFGEHLAAARECMRKAQERQAKYYNKNRTTLLLEPGDMVLVSRHALQGLAQGDEKKKFAKRWHGPFAVKTKINNLAYSIDLPAEWRNHRTINIGFLKKFKNSPEYTRTLTKPTSLTTTTGDSLGVTEVRAVRQCSRRGQDRREFQVRWQGERALQWISEKQLQEATGEDEFNIILNSLNQNNVS